MNLAQLETALSIDPGPLIKKYQVTEDKVESLPCPRVNSILMLLGQQRSSSISETTLDLRDYIFHYRGVFAFSVGQFVNFWSYYDGFLRTSAKSCLGDRIKLTCNWRSCPAIYNIYLLKTRQTVIVYARDEHYHSVMDSVTQLPNCTIIRYHVLDALTSTDFDDVSRILEFLSRYPKTILLRSGLDCIELEYIEKLRGMLHRPTGDNDEHPPTKRQKLA